MTSPESRPRVEGEWLTMTEAEAGILLSSFVDDKPIRFLLDEITAQSAELARLTAEVERLRGVVELAEAVVRSELRLPAEVLDTPEKQKAWLAFWPAVRAALALPTNAPEAKE